MSLVNVKSKIQMNLICDEGNQFKFPAALGLETAVNDCLRWRTRNLPRMSSEIGGGTTKITYISRRYNYNVQLSTYFSNS